jgi:hypothetical protein
MRYRCFRVIATGQWLDVLFSSDSGVFSIDESSHRTDIAIAMSIEPSTLESVEGDRDLRDGTLVVIPAQSEDPILVRIAILDAKLADDSMTFDELKELMRLKG